MKKLFKLNTLNTDCYDTRANGVLRFRDTYTRKTRKQWITGKPEEYVVQNRYPIMDLNILKDPVELFEETDPGYLSADFIQWFNKHANKERTPESIEDEDKFLKEFNLVLIFSALYYRVCDKESDWVEEVFRYYGKYYLYDFIKHAGVTKAAENEVWASKVIAKRIDIFSNKYSLDHNKKIVTLLDTLQSIL